MHALAYLILAVARMLGLIINIYTFVIAAAILISWVNADPYNPIVKVIRNLTEPAFNMFRKITPSRLYRTGFDFTPLVVMLALILIDTVLVNLLRDVGMSMLMK
ncbi:MAG: YggT family protein [Deltaproteobacteria bacterium]|nr:YggT family protein [Deltaproteobacteria bacterium]MBI2974590.1 YggT family protein [Deltaproteobacteria bacterium]